MTGSIATELVRAVAAAKDTEPTALEYELQEYVPVDAIEQLANHENGSWTVSFELPEYVVTVTSEGEISVEEARTESNQRRS